MSHTVFGIRHHGPGSARSLKQALQALQPDVILVEGPPDAEPVLPLAIHSEMQPPVALLVYRPDEPKRAVYYPFVAFSPEWQAIRYGLQHEIPVRFMDLPQAHRLALEDTSQSDEDDAAPIRQDPLRWVAEAAGDGDGERWWEHRIERRRDSSDVFQAVLELMSALREEAASVPENSLEAQREAHMRKTLRTAQKDGFERIAVVCGAWHAPALATLPPAKHDNALLKGLPKVKVTATWIPWTYGRMAYHSGYGAGVESPGFYHHLWSNPDGVAIQWMVQVAALLRAHDLSASTASVIEAVRLAESLAALREHPLPGLPELNEAARAVFCAGDDTPMALIHTELTVGERLGAVPEDTPSLPLQQDLQRQQKRLRLRPEADQRDLELDLRKPNDLARSQLLHRLNLLNIPWGSSQRAAGNKGTFRENWRLQWQPELEVAIIEASTWGNSVVDAASAYTCHKAQQTEALAELTALVEMALLAELADAIEPLLTRLQNAAALTSDIPHLMEALPPLANALRYGNVRQTDTALISQVVDGLVTRICIGLPAACSALNDEAAQAMFERLLAVHSAINLLQNAALLEQWSAVLRRLAEQASLHGLLAGRCCRLLLDQNALSAEAVAQRMNLALSKASEPPQAAAWVEGFLHGSGLILLHNETLWRIVDEWVMALRDDVFTALLPLLRRTFTTFPAPERRQMGERVKHGTGSAERPALATSNTAFDAERADKVLPIVGRLLGLSGSTMA